MTHAFALQTTVGCCLVQANGPVCPGRAGASGGTIVPRSVMRGQRPQTSGSREGATGARRHARLRMGRTDASRNLLERRVMNQIGGATRASGLMVLCLDQGRAPGSPYRSDRYSRPGRRFTLVRRMVRMEKRPGHPELPRHSSHRAMASSWRPLDLAAPAPRPSRLSLARRLELNRP